MKFSINYSTQAAVLYSVGKLQIDRFKCPDWPSLIQEALQYAPVAVHFTLSAGRMKLASKDLDMVERIADQTETPYINLHLEAKLRDYPTIPIDSHSSVHRSRVLSQTLREVEQAVQRFSRERVVVENVPFRPQGNVLRFCVEPECIQSVVAQTGCGFLLDIPHATITAQHLHVSEKDYISNLPIHSLKEMHFTGVHSFGDWLQDHVPADESDWQTLDWVLNCLRLGLWPKPWMLAYEVGGVGEKFAWRTPAQAIERDARRIVHSIRDI